ncbi:Intracellular distribution of mitochondria [Coelomomyces lativittatus]|nr:Intracellular distribution of mitochondria [Coelomomyces lativittatus]
MKKKKRIWSIQPEDTTLDPHETPEELAQLYTYLYDRVIPTFVEDLSKVISIPTSGLNLTNILHSRGISMRHLGIILTTVDNERSSKKTVPGILLRLDALSLLLKREMWLRCFKHLVRHYLKINHNSKSLISPTHVIAHLFTSFLSIDSMNIQDCENSNNNSKKINHEHPHSHKNKKTISSENSTMEKVWTQPILCPASYLDITSSFLRSYLLQQVSIRYRYQLSTDFDFLVVKHVMLREICLRLGVQLKAQPYAPHYCIKEEDVNRVTKDPFEPVLKRADLRVLIESNRINNVDRHAL